MYKVLSLALILGLLGALGNAFPLQSGNLIQLHFGYVAVLVAASLFFPWVAFPVAVISVIPGIYAGLSFWSILIYLAGALWVSLLRGRGYAVIVSSTVYWVVILLPIMMLLQQGKLDTLFWIDVLELMLNG
ncbi:MAG TPA: hypothetical protein VLA24_13345, partial [Pseudomonadales bacterium]|nr:hypothetical protein [Pseudomonadales bacterium]